MLENMIVKLQTLTGGLRGGKSLHHFVFNGLDLIVKHCLPLLFRKEPIYRGRRKGHRARAPENGISISLEFFSSAEPLQSPLPTCLSTLPGTPPASTGELAQPRLCAGSCPGAAHTPCPDVSFLGCSLAMSCWLPASAGHTPAVEWPAGKDSSDRARRALMAPPQLQPTFWGCCVCDGWQLPVPKAELCPQPCCAPTLLAAVWDHGQNE